MRAHEFLTETPLQSYTTMGDFDKPGPFRGTDKKLVPHPTNQLKTQKFFDKTPYDFRLFFSHLTGTGKYSETGPVSHEFIEKIFKEHAPQIIEGSDDAITIVFVGNSGDAKVPLTPWVMAHRFGHAIQAGERRSYGRNTGTAWNEMENHFLREAQSILSECYQARHIKSLYENPDVYRALFNAIGTQRSSRNNKISRPYEFIYEMLAQYLGSGEVKLNPLPTQIGYGKMAWGKPIQSLYLAQEYRDDAKEISDRLARDMAFMFSDVLDSAVGNIYVM